MKDLINKVQSEGCDFILNNIIGFFLVKWTLRGNKVSSAWLKSAYVGFIII